ncbi:MAG: methyltransferase domain-containing protein [Pseudonocardia sp.]
MYGNTVLITDLRHTGSRTEVVCSSSQPSLMIRMLEALGVRAGHRVLEIGTGTSYNAALMSHRLGDDQVFSVDVEPDLIDRARTRLARLGHHPTLHAGDGTHGLPDDAPFDGSSPTCAVPAVPWAWVDQLRPGGQLLTDLKIGHGAGSLVQLTRTGDTLAHGRFNPTYAAFMDLRPTIPAVPARTAPRPRPRQRAADHHRGPAHTLDLAARLVPRRPPRRPRHLRRLRRQRTTAPPDHRADLRTGRILGRHRHPTRPH